MINSFSQRFSFIIFCLDFSLCTTCNRINVYPHPHPIPSIGHNDSSNRSVTPTHAYSHRHSYITVTSHSPFSPPTDHSHGHSHGGSSHGHSHGGSKKSPSAKSPPTLPPIPSTARGHLSSFVGDDDAGEADPALVDGRPRTAGAQQMNMRGVFLHVLADAIGSVIVIISAVVIWKTDWEYRMYVDPALSMIMVMLILRSVYPLCECYQGPDLYTIQLD